MNMRAKFFGAIAGVIVFLSVASNAQAQCPTTMSLSQAPIGQECGANVSYSVSNPNGFQFIQFDLDGTPISTQQSGSIYLDPGTYTFAVSTADLNNCTMYIEEEITILPAVSVQFQNNTVACNGMLGLNVSVQGGSGNYTYAWEPSSLMNNPSSAAPSMSVGSATSVVSVTVTDNLGCSQFAEMVVYPNLPVNQTVELCSGSVDLNLDPGSVMYNWSATDVNGDAIDMTGVTGNTFTATQVGTYVVVTYYTGCNVTTHQFVVEQCTSTACPTAMLIVPQASGCGANVDFEVINPNGFQFIQFALDGAPLSMQISGSVYLEPGTYVFAVSATDANSCYLYLEESITIAPALSIQFQNNTVACNGMLGLNVEASGGSGNYSYAWEPNALMNNASAAAPMMTVGSTTTTVSVAVTDNITGCIRTYQMLVYPNLPVNQTVELCSGSVDLNLDPGSMMYNWSATDANGDAIDMTGVSGNSFTATQVGTYVVVTYYTGCNVTTHQFIVEECSISPCPTAMAITQAPIGQECGANVSYAVTNPNGFQFIEFTLDGMPISTQQSGSIYLEPGTYVFASSTADANNCTRYLEETITIEPAIIVQFQNNTVACSGTLALNVSVSGGTGSYSYSWEPSALMNNPTSASPSMNVGTSITTVSVTVIDENTNCIRTSQMLVYPNLPVNQTVELCGSMADLILDPGSVMYNWSASDPSGNTIDMTGVNSNVYFATESGTYVVVTYYTGCNVTTHQFLVVPCGQDDDVWPGDANSDGEATNTDALWVGLAFNETGPVRAAASNAWIGQPATDWTFDFAQNGVNLKHADCDGNGVVNFADTIAISQNYGLTHGKTESALGGGYPMLWVEATPDTVGLSQAVYITVHLADAAMPVDSLHGIAFTLTFNETLVVADDLTVDFSNNALGTVGSDVLTLQKPFFPNGEIDVAISRTTLENYAGYGPLLTARIVTTDNLSGVHELRIGISGVTAITASEIPVLFTTVADTVFIDSERVGINEQSSLDFRVYPNPSQGVFQLEGLDGNVNVEVMDATGRVFERMQNSGNGRLTVDMSHQTAGMYVMRVWNETGFAVKRIELLGH